MIQSQWLVADDLTTAAGGFSFSEVSLICYEDDSEGSVYHWLLMTSPCARGSNEKQQKTETPETEGAWLQEEEVEKIGLFRIKRVAI